MKLFKSQVERLIECPDCRGEGRLATPASNWNRWVVCARCDGNGFVQKEREVEHE